MKVVAVLITSGVLAGSPAAATAPDTWNARALIGEAAAGLGLGACALVATSQADDDNDDDGINWTAVAGWSLGNAGGVLVVGEIFDHRSDNWYITYPATIVGAGLAPVTVGLIIRSQDLHWDDALVAGFIMAFGTPVVTTLTYNLVKEPHYGTSTGRNGVDVQPYAALLADDGAGYVQVYGLSASF